MKRIYTLLLGIALAVTPMMALTYDDAARQAYYLTDKMAYELNLTDAQYDRVYQINLDYFLRCEREADLYGYLWEYRNARLARILATAQWRLYNDALYFYRPLRWISGSIYFAIHDRYAHDRFYRPVPPPSYHGPAYGHYQPGHHGSHTHTPPPPPARPGYGHNNYKPGHGDYKPGHGDYKPGHGDYKPGHSNSGYRPDYGGRPTQGNGGYRPGGGGSKPSDNGSKPGGNFGGSKPNGGHNGSGPSFGGSQHAGSQSGSRGGFSGHGRK